MTWYKFSPAHFCRKRQRVVDIFSGILPLPATVTCGERDCTYVAFARGRAAYEFPAGFAGKRGWRRRRGGLFVFWAVARPSFWPWTPAAMPLSLPCQRRGWLLRDCSGNTGDGGGDRRHFSADAQRAFRQSRDAFIFSIALRSERKRIRGCR